jgi:hypothetical protein
MRARPRPRTIAAAAAAVTIASVPLWSATAGAGDSPDESHQAVRTVSVDGVDCQVGLYSARFDQSVQAQTRVLTTADQCQTFRVSVTAFFRTAHGDVASAASDDTGPNANVAGGGAVDLIRTEHIVVFTSGPTSATWTMQSK